MKVRELRDVATGHADDGRHADDEVILLVGRTRRTVETSYSDHSLILIAGPKIPQ